MVRILSITLLKFYDRLSLCPKDASGDDSDDLQEDEDHEVADHSVNSSNRVAKAKPGITQVHSTFLPSLAVGFTRGDPEDSDWSDGELRQTEGTFKKNRRGQRARRAYVQVLFRLYQRFHFYFYVGQHMGKEIRSKCKPQKERERRNVRS
jgi:hypothetical protein